MSEILIATAQFNPTVGDLAGNAEAIISWSKKARAQGASLIIFPELALTGYPPEDLLLRPHWYQQLERTKNTLYAALPEIDVILGYPRYTPQGVYNAAGYIQDGCCTAEYHKRILPNYGVFDEQRYFQPGQSHTTITHKGIHFGLSICEDLWQPLLFDDLASEHTDCLISLNASPYTLEKHNQRLDAMRRCARHVKRPLIYANSIGSQDGLVFEGRSFSMSAEGHVTSAAPPFEATLHMMTIHKHDHITCCDGHQAPTTNPLDDAWKALCLGLRDYTTKNGFQDVLLGLSGGIDSALTAVLACEALGPEHVTTVAMPSRYTSDLSNDVAREQADMLGTTHSSMTIEPMLQAFETHIPYADAKQHPLAHQNLQARLRGTLLMTMANATGKLLLSTSNKSEAAVGYTTLYGDMAGGYAPLKDVYKTQVYALAQHVQSQKPCIPNVVLTRAPSAELAPNQCDEDSLPPYAALDEILKHYIEQHHTSDEIIQAGFPPDTTKQVIGLVKASEHKRRQAPPGTKITERSFDKDWRYPITLHR